MGGELSTCSSSSCLQTEPLQLIRTCQRYSRELEAKLAVESREEERSRLEAELVALSCHMLRLEVENLFHLKVWLRKLAAKRLAADMEKDKAAFKNTEGRQDYMSTIERLEPQIQAAARGENKPPMLQSLDQLAPATQPFGAQRDTGATLQQSLSEGQHSVSSHPASSSSRAASSRLLPITQHSSDITTPLLS